MITLVTGARSGIGLVTAVELARAGHTVYAGLRDLDTAGRLEEAARGLDVRPIQLDITSASDRQRVAARIREAHGRLDALVNNAGVALGGFVETVDEDELRQVFEVNLFGTWALTRDLLPLLRVGPRSTVVMVSSMSGRMAVPALGVYASSKFALEGLSESWRHELALFGIRLVLVEPGPYKTDIFGRNRWVTRNAHDPAGPYAPWIRGLDALTERMAARATRDPKDVADRIVSLVRERSPPLRVPMGADARARSLLLRVVPTRALDLLFARVLARVRED